MTKITYGQHDTTYRAVGEYDGLVRLVDAFYDFMDLLPEAKVIRQQHPDDLTQTKDKLVCFLSGWMGGPKRYQQKYGAISIPGSHSHLMIGLNEKDAWLLCMDKAMEQCQYPDDLRQYLLKQFHFPAQKIVQTSKSSFKK